MNFFLIKGFMTELLNTTGKRVERLRKDKHWTQKQLSAAADVRQSYISGIENDTASPSAEIMARVAKALGTSLDFLMMISDNPVVKEDSEPEFFSPEASLLVACALFYIHRLLVECGRDPFGLCRLPDDHRFTARVLAF